MTIRIGPYRRGGYEVDIRFTWPDGTPFRERLRSPVTWKSASQRWAEAREGATPLAIQQLAGHEHISTTMKYMHLSPTGRGAAIALLDRASETAENGGGRGDIFQTEARAKMKPKLPA